MSLELRSHSPDRTFKIGKALGELLRGDEFVFISGDLGVGKTLLTKGVAGALCVEPSEVVSPTFTLMNQFLGTIKDQVIKIYHFDLYRWGEMVGNDIPEIDEYIGEGIIVVEWAQYLPSSYFSLKNSVKVDFTFPCGGSNDRIIRIQSRLDYIDTGLAGRFTD